MEKLNLETYDFTQTDKDNPYMQKIREKFPQYEGVPDSLLTQKVVDKYYPGVEDAFYEKTGLTRLYNDIKPLQPDQQSDMQEDITFDKQIKQQTEQNTKALKEPEKSYKPKLDFTNINTLSKSLEAQNEFNNLLHVNPITPEKDKIQADWAAKEVTKNLTANPHDSNMLDQVQSSLLKQSRASARGVAKFGKDLLERLNLNNIAEHIDIPQAFSQEEADHIVGFAKEDRNKKQLSNQKLYNQWQGILDGTNKNYVEFALGSIKQVPSTLADSSGELAQLLSGTPGLATAVNTRVSNFEDEYTKNNGKKPDPSWYLQTALTQTALLGAERFGLTKVLPKMLKNPKSSLLATGIGAIGEGVQEYGEGVSEEYHTQKKGDKSFKEILSNPQHSFAATQGAAAGGAISGAVNTSGKIYQNLNKKQEEKEEQLNDNKALELNTLNNHDGVMYRLNELTAQGQDNFRYYSVNSNGEIVEELDNPETKNQDRFRGTPEEQTQIEEIIHKAFNGNQKDTTTYLTQIQNIVKNSQTNKIHKATQETDQVSQEIDEGYQQLAQKINSDTPTQEQKSEPTTTDEIQSETIPTQTNQEETKNELIEPTVNQNKLKEQEIEEIVNQNKLKEQEIEEIVNQNEPNITDETLTQNNLNNTELPNTLSSSKLPNNYNNKALEVKQIKGDNFVMNESKQAPYQYDGQSFQVQKWINDLSGVLNDEWTTNLKSLAIKHPEMFKSEADVFRVVKEIKDNPTHFFKNNKDENALIGKVLDNDKFGEIGVRKDNGRIIHTTSINKDKRLEELEKRQKKILGDTSLAESSRSARLDRHSDTSQTMATANAGSATEKIIPHPNENINLHEKKDGDVLFTQTAFTSPNAKPQYKKQLVKKFSTDGGFDYVVFYKNPHPTHPQDPMIYQALDTSGEVIIENTDFKDLKARINELEKEWGADFLRDYEKLRMFKQKAQSSGQEIPNLKELNEQVKGYREIHSNVNMAGEHPTYKEYLQRHNMNKNLDRLNKLREHRRFKELISDEVYKNTINPSKLTKQNLDELELELTKMNDKNYKPTPRTSVIEANQNSQNKFKQGVVELSKLDYNNLSNKQKDIYDVFFGE